MNEILGAYIREGMEGAGSITTGCSAFHNFVHAGLTWNQ